ncbi:TPA: hypothetical protein DCE37_23375 [Candidatus Latescibacteria bacterium]|nr:hypothetical protein [Candidatus Latescibacterota bacterium]
MATIEVNGGIIDYELFGEGPCLVLNAGGRSARGIPGFQRDHLMKRCSLLLWDRRNSAGASDVHLTDAASPMHADADDLHALLQALDVGQVCVGGGSAGCALSLRMAVQYPDVVNSVLAIAPASRDSKVMGGVAEATWSGFVKVAQSRGMSSVIELSIEAHRRVNEKTGDRLDTPRSWIASSLEATPANRDRLLDMDPAQFSEMMLRWGHATMHGGAMAGLTEEELRSIDVPTLVIAGNDEVHPPESATRLADCLKHSHAPTVEYPGAEHPDPMTRTRVHMPHLDSFLEETLLS